MPTGVQPRLGPVEAPDPILDLVTFYTENLAVPQRRDVGDPTVLRGKQLLRIWLHILPYTEIRHPP